VGHKAADKTIKERPQIALVSQKGNMEEDPSSSFQLQPILAKPSIS
jgi:hypothetical protein